MITHEVCVREDLTWTISIHGNELHQIANTPLSNIPLFLGPPSLNKLITTLDEASVCPGNPDEQYAPMVAARKGVFLSVNGEEKARLEKDFPVVLNGDVYHQTIRTSTCRLLVGQGKCGACKLYRSQLRAIWSRWSKRVSVSAKHK